MHAIAELVAVPMFCPMMSAQAWSGPTAPAKYADSVTAMAAVDDCITAVIASPSKINASRPNKLGHQLTPGPKTAGRSAGCNRSANPPIPCCRVVNPKSTSANPASAPPAADTRPRPNSLIKAPTKIIGNAAAVSETRTPMSAMSQPVPVVPTFAPNTSPRPWEKLSSPALTRPMVVIVVALDDCTISVTMAPQNAPDKGLPASLPRVVRSFEPASALRPPVMTLMPSRNRPTPPRTEIVVDMRGPPGASPGPAIECTAAIGGSQPAEVPYFSRVSAARIDASSFFFAASTFGYVRSSCSTASTIAAATARRVNHLLSAGTTNQGACFDAVARIASSNARI